MPPTNCMHSSRTASAVADRVIHVSSAVGWQECWSNGTDARLEQATNNEIMTFWTSFWTSKSGRAIRRTLQPCPIGSAAYDDESGDDERDGLTSGWGLNRWCHWTRTRSRCRSYGPILYNFRYKARCWSKIVVFFTPTCIRRSRSVCILYYVCLFYCCSEAWF